MTTTQDLHQNAGLYAVLYSTREWLGRFPVSILQLGMRIGVGMVFFNAGVTLPLPGMISIIQIFVYPNACRMLCFGIGPCIPAHAWPGSIFDRLFDRAI